MNPDTQPIRPPIDWRSPRVIVALAAIAVVILAVPAWARMDDGGNEMEPAVTGPMGGPAPRVAPAPMPGPASGMPALPPDGAGPRGEMIVPAPPPPPGGPHQGGDR